MKKSILIISLFFATLVANAQTNENAVEQITSKLTLHLPSTDAANLFSESRFIQIGLFGNTDDVNAMVGYFERFLMNGKTLVNHQAFNYSANQISYYKFYLDPLNDANDFQRMLEMVGFKKFIFENKTYDIQHFSNTVYSFIKLNSKE